MSAIPDGPPKDDDIVTVQMFARRWRVEETIVRGWIRKGYIDWVLIDGTHMKRVRKSDIAKQIEPSQPRAQVQRGGRK